MDGGEDLKDILSEIEEMKIEAIAIPINYPKIDKKSHKKLIEIANVSSEMINLFIKKLDIYFYKPESSLGSTKKSGKRLMVFDIYFFKSTSPIY